MTTRGVEAIKENRKKQSDNLCNMFDIAVFKMSQHSEIYLLRTWNGKCMPEKLKHLKNASKEARKSTVVMIALKTDS